jgi:hypothetical protein
MVKKTYVKPVTERFHFEANRLMKEVSYTVNYPTTGFRRPIIEADPEEVFSKKKNIWSVWEDDELNGWEDEKED